jgi:uncharacterized membrane protein
MQSKKESIIEALLNVGSGMLIAFLIMQFILAPTLGVQISPGQNGIVTIVLTVVSICRGYLWRRMFNKIAKRRMEKRIKELQNQKDF